MMMKATKVVYLRLLPEDKQDKKKFTDIFDCPIARAVKRVCKPGMLGSVGPDGFSLKIENDDWPRLRVTLPNRSGCMESVYRHPNRVTRIRVGMPKIALA